VLGDGDRLLRQSAVTQQVSWTDRCYEAASRVELVGGASNLAPAQPHCMVSGHDDEADRFLILAHIHKPPRCEYQFPGSKCGVQLAAPRLFGSLKGSHLKTEENVLPREDWNRIQELFLEAANLPSSERAAFLDGTCDGNSELRMEVESLLRADSTGGSEVRAAIESEVTSMLDGPSLVDTRLGSYRLLKEIGRGGMGTVYLAERADGQFQKQVAIKMVRPGMDTEFILARFRRERQVLGRFDHPNIGRLLDGGTALLTS